MIIVLIALVILETAGLIFLCIRGRKIDGEIHVLVRRDDFEGETIVWDIRTNTPEKITEANGQIVRFKVVNMEDSE